ncbi:MAG TPA: TolC family protein [Candidatus Acidoferrum sp.]|nr:TolC family protein [Candidatus Acidoferrum sp.]
MFRSIVIVGASLMMILPLSRAAEPDASGANTNRVLTLDECLQMAMEKNRMRAVSRYVVAAAEAQHRQALSGYWPQIHVKAAYQHMDEAPNFIFPASTLPTPIGPFDVPKQDVKLMDPDSVIASGSAVWLLYDGGMRKGYREQSRAGVDAANQELRRTDLEIADSVRRMYHGSILARQLHQLGKDTLARMEATLSLTETMYKEGGGKVTKADYLDNKVSVETLRSMTAQLERNEIMAQAALANTMGLTWRDSVRPADDAIPFTPYAANLNQMVSTAYDFSPDWARLEAGIRAMDGSERTARSGHHPKVALTGELHTWWNEYDAGMSSRENKNGWIAGVAVEFPLFDGFLTRNKVKQARANADKIREQKFLLQDGIGLQVKDIFVGLDATKKSHQATLDAMKAASENRDLNTRAYQNELVETEKVIRAQLTEAIMSAIHFKTRYDYVVLQSKLNLVIGTEVWKRLESTP